MMDLFKALLAVLMIFLSSVVNIQAEAVGNETSERTIEELCSDCFKNCTESLELLHKILQEMNIESRDAQIEQFEFQYENRALLHEITILRLRIAHPTSEYYFQKPTKPDREGILQQGMVFAYLPDIGDCESLKKCIESLVLAKRWLTSWEEQNEDRRSKVNYLRAENLNLTSLRDELKQQWLSQQNNNITTTL